MTTSVPDKDAGRAALRDRALVTLDRARSSYGEKRYKSVSLIEAQAGLGGEAARVRDPLAPPRAYAHEAEFDSVYVALVQRHYDAIVRYIHGMVPVPQQAEDLAQDTFLKAYLALRSSGAPANARPWLFRIASNTTLDYVRRRTRIGMVALERVGHLLSVRDRTDDFTAANPVEKALAALRAEDRSVLLLFAEAGFTAPEVAAILGISPAAARKRRQRARDAFVNAYSEADGEV
jgi:RNA polymerase sigma-70 factor (ECF subfamily)